MRKLLILIPILVTLSGCGTMHYEGTVQAPPASDEQLSTAEEPPASGWLWKRQPNEP